MPIYAAPAITTDPKKTGHAAPSAPGQAQDLAPARHAQAVNEQLNPHISTA